MRLLLFIQLFVLFSFAKGQHKEVSDILGPEVEQQDLIQTFQFDSVVVDSVYSNQKPKPAIDLPEVKLSTITIDKKGKKVAWLFGSDSYRFYFLSVTETEEKFVYQIVNEKTGSSWYLQLDRQQKRAILFDPAANIRYTLK